MFKPLASAYSSELTAYLHRSQGLIPINKGNFFPLFWKAWITSFRSELVRKSFEATGVVPANADIILKRFNNHTSNGDESSSSEPQGDGSSWKQLRHLIDNAMKDKAEKPSQKLSAAMHSLQVQNELLHHKIDGLRSALTTKKKHQKKSKPLDLQQRKEYHSGGVCWSPRKVREARARESVKQKEKEAEKLYKAESKQLKAAAALYKKKMA
ncbi:hypothetical protein EJ02DRAFT_474070, partial [Clathrospora elynae]